jgi:hypothetical protein
MGHFSVRFYGIDLSEKFEDIQESLGETLRAAGKAKGPGFFPDDEEFYLGEYLQGHRLGVEHYDGGGYGQITYIGFSLKDDHGVDDAVRARFDDYLGRLPEELRAVLVEVFGSDFATKAKAQTESGWG